MVAAAPARLATPAPAPVAPRPAPAGLDGWRSTLAAVRLPNTLLVAGDVDAGALDLTHAHPSGLATLLAGRPARLSSLVREPEALAAAQRRVRAIRSAAGILSLDRGIHGGYLAAGLARWRGLAAQQRPGDGPPLQEALSAPVLLRRCTLRPHGAGHDDYDLDLDAAAVVNPLLLHRLRTDHAVVADGLALAGLAFGPGGFNPEPVFEQLAELCSGVPAFRIEPALLVGTFTAGSGQLLADLELSAPAVRIHRLLGRAVAAGGPAAPPPSPPSPPSPPGSPSPPGPRTGSDPEPAQLPAGEDLSRFDAPPVDLVLDLDPAQRAAVELALSGKDITVEGPPGSGLTQTLAAAVGGLVGRGKRVLVVTPHRGTADAFVARMAEAGLGGFVLNLHDGGGDRAGILAGLGAGLELALAPRERTGAGAPGPPGRAGGGEPAGAERFATARDGLLGAAQALHAVREPWGVSAYQAMVALADLMASPSAPRTRIRLPLEVTRRLDSVARERLREDLRDAARRGAFTLTRIDTRWLDARVHSEQEAERALAAAVAARDALPAARAAMRAVAQAAGLPEADAVGGWRPQLELLLGIRNTLDVMLPAVYEQPLGDLVAATGGRGTVSGPNGEPVGRLGRRMLRRRARALVRPGVQVRDKELHALLRAAQQQRQGWVEAGDGGGGWPRVPTGLAPADAAVRAVEAPLGPLCAALEGTGTPDLLRLPLEKLEQRLADLACDPEGVRQQPERTVLLAGLRAAGLDSLINDLQERRAGPQDVDGELDLAWWTSVLEAVIRSDPQLARHEPGAQRRWAGELREADAALLAGALAGIKEELGRRAREVADREAGQARWLRAEVHRGHRSEWPADLFRRAGDLVAALRPVWVMSPDTVARVLPSAMPGELVVDVVVVDDAGQVGMPEAAAALARGTQTLVAGDRRRLPPATGGPSVLEVTGALTGVHRLDRDHRSRDGRLLAPLLGDYPGRWAQVPGTAAVAPLSLHLVDAGEGVPPPGEDLAISPEAEVAAVVDLVAEHAMRRPGESLLVITLGARHAERIEEGLRRAVARDRALAGWLDVHWTGGVDEPFLVRPVHRIAGLERDAVIISVGMAKRPAPSVVRGFGVLDGRFGRACLRAALSRARRRVVLTSCFAAKDLPPDGDFSDGMRMLREVLWAATLGPAPAGAGVAGADAPVLPDPLVADLRRRLEEAGMPVESGVAAADRPLDLAVGDPLEPGRRLVAVELDGPQYAACPSARLRDRGRAQAFERAGWTYLRVSAMDLFCDPAGEVERIRDAWRAAGGLPATVVPAAVLPRPPVVRGAWPTWVVTGLPVSAYSAEELDAVAWWVVSDGVGRPRERVAAEVRSALGLPTAQTRVEAAVGAAAERVLRALEPPVQPSRR